MAPDLSMLSEFVKIRSIQLFFFNDGRVTSFIIWRRPNDFVSSKSFLKFGLFFSVQSILKSPIKNNSTRFNSRFSRFSSKISINESIFP